MKNIQEKIDKRIVEVEELYKKKIANLQQTMQLSKQLEAECINLEGQLQSLKELNQNEDSN